MAAAGASAANTLPPSAAVDGGRVVVVGHEYCFPHPVQLVMNQSRAKQKYSSGSEKFSVKDFKDNLFFRVEWLPFSRDDQVVRNAAGVPIVTLKPKFWSFSGRWQVFRGEGDHHLIFSIKKRSSLFRLKNKFKVFLANNNRERKCDFHIRESSSINSYEVYAGESKDFLIAQMQKKSSTRNFSSKEDQFNVAVHPNVDHAFIITLIVALDAINSNGDNSNSSDGDDGGDGGDGGDGDDGGDEDNGGNDSGGNDNSNNDGSDDKGGHHHHSHHAHHGGHHHSHHAHHGHHHNAHHHHHHIAHHHHAVHAHHVHVHHAVHAHHAHHC